jgi:hypothetical protein
MQKNSNMTENRTKKIRGILNTILKRYVKIEVGLQIEILTK